MSSSYADRLRGITPRFLSAPMTPRRTWLTAFLAFVLLGTAWSLAMPYDGPADELQHALRAYGVWSGQIHTSVNLIRVPQSLMPSGLEISFSCFRWHHAVSASCASTPGAIAAQTHQMIMTPSGAAEYNPVYYILTGWPIRIWPTYFGIILSRLLTTLFMSVFIASAISLVSRLNHGRWLLGGLIIALTPVVVNLEGGVNPAGPEIAVGLALWAALIAIIDADQVTPKLIRLACISGTFLAMLRGFGVGWLALILLMAGIGISWPKFKSLMANRTLHRWIPLPAVATVYALWWVHLVGGIANLTNGNPSVVHLTESHVLLDEVWTRSTYYTQGLIALTSYGDVPTPQLVFYIWFGACSLIVLLALALCNWRDRIRIAGIISASYAVLGYADIIPVMHGWWLSQGRYALPLIVGAPMLAAYQLSKTAVFSQEHLHKLTRTLGLVLLPIQLVMLWVTMMRFQSGSRHLNILRGSWLPPLGTELPVLLCCAGIAVYWFAVCRLTPLAAIPSAESGPSGDSEPDDLSVQSGQYGLSDEDFPAIPAQATSDQSAIRTNV
jgi:Predicted membrane protein (DUF2142)